MTQGDAGLPKPETMLAYASILEKQQYVVKNGVKFPIATGEIVEAACAALRHCAALRSSPPPIAGRPEIEAAILKYARRGKRQVQLTSTQWKDGIDIEVASADAILFIESILDINLTPSPSAEPVAWRWKTVSNVWRYEENNSSFPNETQPLYASAPVSDASREALSTLIAELKDQGLIVSRAAFASVEKAQAALSPSFGNTGGEK